MHNRMVEREVSFTSFKYFLLEVKNEGYYSTFSSK